MAFKEYKHLNLPQIAQEVQQFWEEEEIFNRSISEREGAPAYVFFEGPPSANGMPGIHHVMARTIKDLFCRYKTQKGYQVKRKAGWDTHGLPVELGVEKELGISKEDIGSKISVEEYSEACKKAVMRYTDVWNNLTHQMGYWVDTDNPYVTYTPKYMESVWWLLQQIYQKGLLYKGYTIQPYSPMAGTGLSSHELNQPGTYQDVSDTTVTAQFKLHPASLPEAWKSDIPLFALAWTTTPWTLPSNTALTVGPKIDYVIVQTYNQYTHAPIHVILAQKLISKQFAKKYVEVATPSALEDYTAGDKKIPYCVLTQAKGAELIGIQYEQLWEESPLPLENPENAFRIIGGDFVTTEDGTGIVHTAPTFGADDAKVAAEATPPVPPLLVKDEHGNQVPLVDLKGRFRPEVGNLGGRFVKNEYYPEGQAPEKSVDVEIAILLKTQNRAFKVEKYVHAYPNCWRTDKPILYYPLDSWFIKATAVRSRMVDLNQQIHWKPQSTGEGRFGNWLSNANDWNLSRSRFWGIPLPIWRSEDGSVERMIGSVAELKEAIQEAIAANLMEEDPYPDFVLGDMSDANYAHIDLHKHIVDKIVLVGPKGEPLYREPDLIDVWFDSGAMPYAQWHYPFENKEMIDANKAFPADYIAEGVDQTRGWFYTLHAIATLVFDDLAYKNVVSNGLVLDKTGQKMSKRLGNAIDPFETLATHGPDATRWYMIANANPWDNLKFDLEGIVETKRKFFGTLYNTYSFFALYANIDGFDFKAPQIPLADRVELDQWILSELHSLMAQVDEDFKAYEPTRAARAISDFVQEKLSNWYVRLSRRRFWKGSYGPDKIAAYQTLHTCLTTVAQLMAPIAPFFAERLYRDLMKLEHTNASVHITSFPTSEKDYIQPALEKRINKARLLTSLALSIRKKEKIKVRQPLQKMLVPVTGAAELAEMQRIADQLKSEINVKEIEFLDDQNDLLVKEIKPNFKRLGPRFGKQMKAISQAIQGLSQAQIDVLEKEKTLEITLEGAPIQLERDDVEIGFKDIEGWAVAQGSGTTVALDLQLNQLLIQEGIAREFINRVQNHRKDLGLDVVDKIQVTFSSHPDLDTAVFENITYIKQEILAEDIRLQENSEEGLPLEFDTIKSVVEIKKL
ncbi:MAG: isoleucine--tRNA ligase [Flavobacteriaceae bacterium]